MTSDSTKLAGSEDIARRFEKELRVIEAQQLNFSTINVVLFSYGQLRQLGNQFVNNSQGIPLLELLLAQEALTTSVVASYGRLFTKGKGAAKLDPDKIPAEYRAAHEQLMEWRHNRYAHNGTHKSMSKTVTLTVEGEEITVCPEQTTGLYIGGADSWGPLFLWINRHLFEVTRDYLSHLSQKTGMRWRMNQGPTPDWMDLLEDSTLASRQPPASGDRDYE